jgi:hypothetical protein
VCRETHEKDFKTKLKDLERRTNEKGKEFIKGLTDEKEKWALAYDKESYLVFMPKPSTHRMPDPGSIVPHIRPKVSTDNQMS